MAEPRFDRARFQARLRTHHLGRVLIARAETGSTNDDALEALASGLPDGVAVVADAQAHGRGRAGRTWTHAPGLGLAISVALHPGCEPGQAGAIPLAAGLALARAAQRLGVAARLKWPNDVLWQGRKLAGVLCEMRRTPDGDAVVIGAGVNVRQAAADFPPEIRERATSFRLAGAEAAVEDVAAEFLNALEPLWTELEEGDRRVVLDGWRENAAFWGEPVTARTPGGEVRGIAQRLEDSGALVLRLESGLEATVLAGDLEPEDAGGGGGA